MEHDSFDKLIAKLQYEVDKLDLQDFSSHALNLFKNPVNLKSIPLGTPGLIVTDGYSDCGDFIQFFIIINGKIIKDITYLYQGCDVTSIVASQIVILARNKSILDVYHLSTQDIKNALGLFPSQNNHTIEFVKNVLNNALIQYFQKNGWKNGEINNIV